MEGANFNSKTSDMFNLHTGVLNVAIWGILRQDDLQTFMLKHQNNILKQEIRLPLTLLNVHRCRPVSPPTSSKQVEVWVSPQHPETIVVTAEGLHSGPFGHIPNPDALVLRVGQDEFLARVEDGTGHVVVVTAARI